MSQTNSHQNRRHFMLKSLTGLAGALVTPVVAKSLASTAVPASDKKFIYRTLGRTGIKLPIVSVGANAENPGVYQAALDAGLKHIDTANVYLNGRHEELIGQVIKNRPRDSFVIGTKIYEPYNQKTGLFKPTATAESFIQKFEISLKRLGLDYVEMLSIHDVVRKESVVFEPFLNALQKMKQAGTARAIGVSFHIREPELIQAAIECKVLDFIITAYNFRQPHASEVKKAIAAAAQAGLGVIAMKTQAGVYWDRERKQPINMKAALKWVLQDENVHTSIPGFSTIEEMEVAMSVMTDLKLNPGEAQDLKLGSNPSLPGLYCAQCQECMRQCPHEVPIPTLMRSYMYAYGYRKLQQAKTTLQALDLSQFPCPSCTHCSVVCTQGFDVRTKICDISRILSVPEDFLV